MPSFFSFQQIKNLLSNQMFRCTRCNAPKHVTSLRGYLLVIASPSVRTTPSPDARQHRSHRRNIAAVWQAVGNTMPDLTSPKFEPLTSRSRDERVAARPNSR